MDIDQQSGQLKKLLKKNLHQTRLLFFGLVLVLFLLIIFFINLLASLLFDKNLSLAAGIFLLILVLFIFIQNIFKEIKINFLKLALLGIFMFYFAWMMNEFLSPLAKYVAVSLTSIMN